MNLEKHPVVSVLMPVYNTAKFLPDAIKSILAQTYTDFEFIIINDGSTDNSLEIIARYAAEDRRIRFFTRNNRGISITRQEGVSLASGEFIANMDSDDISLPNRLEKQMEFLGQHPECVCVGTWMLHIDPQGAPICRNCKYVRHSEIDQAHLQGEAGAFPHPTALLRLAAVRDVGGYRPCFEVAEDYDLFLRLAEIGQLANIPSVLYYYRQHIDSICHKTTRHTEDRMRALHDAQRRRGIKRDLYDIPDLQVREIGGLAELYRCWSWRAFQSGYKATARKYAFKALLQEPCTLHSYAWLCRTLYTKDISSAVTPDVEIPSLPTDKSHG